MKRALLALCMLGGLLAAAGAQALEVNTANQAELESLKGIGTQLSQRLLDARAQRPFTDWTDLMQRVSGVRAANAKRLSAAGLTVAGARYDAGTADGAMTATEDTAASATPAASGASAAR